MSTLEPRIGKLLFDIYISSKRIVDLLRGESQDKFMDAGSLDIQDIIARRLTIIGEAAAALLRKYPDFCRRHPEIPLRQARGMRNVLIHEYDSIDWLAVWDTAQDGLPQLIEAIEPLLQAKV